MPAAIRLVLPGDDTASTLDRLASEDALGQLLRRDGRMRELATEGDDVKLDWVDGVEKALAHRDWLAAVENEAADLIRAGIRHVIWAGMGGSVQTVYTLCRLGYFAEGSVSVHPLDSTDPATLNSLLSELAALEGLKLDGAGREAALRTILERTAMIGVSMGMTSEEPITHLEWFDGLLKELGIANPGDHIQVMTLPDSYLDRFAKARGSRMVPIQLDAENHTAGRMSAPATRVFLRPAALRLVGDRLQAAPDAKLDGSLLAATLGRCQELTELSHSLSAAERYHLTRRDAFACLGVWLDEQSRNGRNKLLMLLPAGWEGFAPWLEQLVEESLGKGGKGIVILYGQNTVAAERFGEDVLALDLRVGGRSSPDADALRRAGRTVATLEVPLAEGTPRGLGEVAALCLGFERTVAVFGYLQGIVFAGQPAVEAYKRYARELREAPAPVGFPGTATDTATLGCLKLHYETPLVVGGIGHADVATEARRLGGEPSDAAAALAALVSIARRQGWLRYLDLTFNGELTSSARAVFEEARGGLANRALRLPCKLRTGPSDYHSTEQSETDGPAELISIRLVALEHEPVSVGRYSDKFLLAQARGTWQAMADARRWVVMVTFPRLDDAALGDLERLFAEASRLLG